MRLLYLDTETTGLKPYDQIVEIAIIDDDGLTVLDTLVQPLNLTSWREAERIHGITPDMTASAPSMAELAPTIRAAVEGAHVVIYNAGYDLMFLGEHRASMGNVSCAMLAFAEYFNEWDEYRQSHRWQRLHVAAEHVGHVWDGAAHRARADAHACRSVWRFLAEQPARAARP
jgi:DNA polymerase-3 subunit epsilon